jgi:hypothetical protein
MSWGLRESGVADIRWALDIKSNNLTAFGKNFPSAKLYEMSVDQMVEHLKNVSMRFTPSILRVIKMLLWENRDARASKGWSFRKERRST